MNFTRWPAGMVNPEQLVVPAFVSTQTSPAPVASAAAIFKPQSAPVNAEAYAVPFNNPKVPLEPETPLMLSTTYCCTPFASCTTNLYANPFLSQIFANPAASSRIGFGLAVFPVESTYVASG